MVKSLFAELVHLSDDTFCPEISHAEAHFHRAADPDVPFSLGALRRLGRSRPSLLVSQTEGLTPTGMRTTFGPGSPVRLEIFYTARSTHGRRPASASIRLERVPSPGVPVARLDVARSSLTEHAVSYLVRNDLLVLPVPQHRDVTTAWEDQLLRTTHWVSDMRRRGDRVFVDGGSVPVLRVDDPHSSWAAAAFDLGAHRITIAGAAGFLDRRFSTRVGG